MSSRPELLIVNPFHADTITELDRRYQTHHLWEIAPDQRLDFIQRLDNCRAAATASWQCDEVVYELNTLEVIAAFGVGVDGIDFEKTSAGGIRVSNTPDVLSDAVADLAMGLIMATTRQMMAADRFVRSGQWSRQAFSFGRSLSGKTLGIAGLGRIGEAVAERAIPCKLNIAYHNRHPRELPYVFYADLGELAEASDILLCLLPGGDSTRGMIDASVFDKLGPEGFFINVGRGGSVDEAALIAALTGGQIAGAGLDVYANEPQVPPELMALENTVLMPHIGSATHETRRSMGHLVLDNLHAFFNGKDLITEVA